jgi:hypothetical protein
MNITHFQDIRACTHFHGMTRKAFDAFSMPDYKEFNFHE